MKPPPTPFQQISNSIKIAPKIECKQALYHNYFQQLENVEKFSLLCIKINYFLNNGSFFEKPKIIKTVISMIRKCKKDFNSIFISLSDSLKSYINAETNLHDEIVSCLEFMGVTDIFD